MLDNKQTHKQLVEKVDHELIILKRIMGKIEREFLYPYNPETKICTIHLHNPKITLFDVCQMMLEKSAQNDCPCRYVLWNNPHTTSYNQKTLIPLFLTTKGCQNAQEMIQKAGLKTQKFQKKTFYISTIKTIQKLDKFLKIQEQSSSNQFLKDLENKLHSYCVNNTLNKEILEEVNYKIQKKLNEGEKKDSSGNTITITLNKRQVRKITSYLKLFPEISKNFKKLCLKTIHINSRFILTNGDCHERN